MDGCRVRLESRAACKVNLVQEMQVRGSVQKHNIERALPGNESEFVQSYRWNHRN